MALDGGTYGLVLPKETVTMTREDWKGRRCWEEPAAKEQVAEGRRGAFLLFLQM